VAVAVLGFVAGARFVRLDDRAARRLASFMWVIGPVRSRWRREPSPTPANSRIPAGTLADAGVARRRPDLPQSLQGLLLTTLNGAIAAMGVAIAGLAVVIGVIVRSTRGPEHIGGHNGASP
jgi:hypothetical protein